MPRCGRSCAPREPLDGLTTRQIPEIGVADVSGAGSPGARDDPPAIRAEGQAEDGRVATAGIIAQAELFLAGGCVPDDHVRGVARGDPAAVGTEDDAPEAAGDVAMGEDL